MYNEDTESLYRWAIATLILIVLGISCLGYLQAKDIETLTVEKMVLQEKMLSMDGTIYLLKNTRNIETLTELTRILEGIAHAAPSISQ